VVGAVIVALVGTVLTVAQPTLQRDPHASLTQVQWTSSGCLVAVASLPVFAGRPGDRYGRLGIRAAGPSDVHTGRSSRKDRRRF
jgi:MFS family permease